MRYVLGMAVLLLAHCVQSTAIVDPATNKAFTASTAATQGTVTLSVNLTAQAANHRNQAFSAMLFQNGSLKAYLKYGTGSTNNSGAASIVMRGVDANFCMTSADATLPNGSYDLYFAINYATQTFYTAFPTACGAPGHLNSIAANMYVQRSSVVVNGPATAVVNDSTATPGRMHWFQLASTTPVTRNFTCIIHDVNASTYASTHAVALYGGTTNGTGDATVNTAAGQVVYLPTGEFRYFCYIDTNGNGNYFESTIDKVASGLLNVTGNAFGSGASTTYLPNASFSTVP